MANIAVELERALRQRAMAGTSGAATQRVLARGHGWTVADVLCTSGPQDRPFEEQHSNYSVAIVTAGSFQYRSSAGRSVMTPGSLLLGTAGNLFECTHEHGSGDRCIAFQYSRAWFDDLVPGAGARRFGTSRIPPLKDMSPLISRVLAHFCGDADASWEEIALQVAARALELSAGAGALSKEPLSAEARVTRVVRRIERQPDGSLTLQALAEEAGLSPYHFLRVFERVTGVTPHQYILRARLRESATRLLSQPDKVLDVALDCGFSDVSNFNRAFRAEFGMSPRDYRHRKSA